MHYWQRRSRDPSFHSRHQRKKASGNETRKTSFAIDDSPAALHAQLENSLGGLSVQEPVPDEGEESGVEGEIKKSAQTEGKENEGEDFERLSRMRRGATLRGSYSLKMVPGEEEEYFNEHVDEDLRYLFQSI